MLNGAATGARAGLAACRNCGPAWTAGAPLLAVGAASGGLGDAEADGALRVERRSLPGDRVVNRGAGVARDAALGERLRDRGADRGRGLPEHGPGMDRRGALVPVRAAPRREGDPDADQALRAERGALPGDRVAYRRACVAVGASPRRGDDAVPGGLGQRAGRGRSRGRVPDRRAIVPVGPASRWQRLAGHDRLARRLGLRRDDDRGRLDGCLGVSGADQDDQDACGAGERGCPGPRGRVVNRRALAARVAAPRRQDDPGPDRLGQGVGGGALAGDRVMYRRALAAVDPASQWRDDPGLRRLGETPGHCRRRGRVHRAGSSAMVAARPGAGSGSRARTGWVRG